ncbi:MAG: acyltransferase [Bacteroidetes bacterium]|nr:MAG: acyltransferase [Bacteroidota bacterium]
MPSPTRRYDIDWLRVIAIWLLIFYHIAIGFQPWGALIGFIQHGAPATGLQVPMSLLSIWRIPLLFFISGMGVSFALRKRNWKALLIERSRRILLPFVFGMVAIVPIHILLWQDYYRQDLVYTPTMGHLWFLGNIFAYVLVLSPLFFYLKAHPEGRLAQGIRRVMGHPLGFGLVVLPFVLEAVVMRPEAFELYAYTWHGFWLGMVAFLTGFLMVSSGASFWESLRRGRWAYLLLAFGLFMVRWLVFGLKSPSALMAIESNLWVFAVLGLGFRYLNRHHAALPYLSQAAYPVYILHMVFLYLGSYVLFPLDLPVGLTFAAVSVITLGGCYASVALIRRLRWLAPLFGLKAVRRAGKTRPVPKPPVEAAG